VPISAISASSSNAAIAALAGLSTRPQRPEAIEPVGRRAPEEDEVELSLESRARSASDQSDAPRAPAVTKTLSDEEKKKVDQLKKRHDEVVTHEQAHVSAGGSLITSGPHYDYATGPDGKPYAVSGHVNIDTSAADTPEATIQKAAQIKRAALAPADPSGADRSVAAAADQLATEARAQLAVQSTSGTSATANPDAATATNEPIFQPTAEQPATNEPTPTINSRPTTRSLVDLYA